LQNVYVCKERDCVQHFHRTRFSMVLIKAEVTTPFLLKCSRTKRQEILSRVQLKYALLNKRLDEVAFAKLNHAHTDLTSCMSRTPLGSTAWSRLSLSCVSAYCKTLETNCTFPNWLPFFFVSKYCGSWFNVWKTDVNWTIFLKQNRNIWNYNSPSFGLFDQIHWEGVWYLISKYILYNGPKKLFVSPDPIFPLITSSSLGLVKKHRLRTIIAGSS
jgi:hypothetical protein